MAIFTVPIHEFNDCHEPGGSPIGGQFCAKGVTRVGITSYRPKDDPGYRSPHAVVTRDLKDFETKLKALPGVTHVMARPGTGAYQSGWEPTWIIGYQGNGEARKLVAETAKRYNQDAVLFMHSGKGAADPAVDLQFEGRITIPFRTGISAVLRAEGLGGWTWGQRGKNTVLRAVSVPDWGGEATDHLEKMRRVSEGIAKLGFTHKMRVKYVKAEVLEKADYDSVISSGKKKAA